MKALAGILIVSALVVAIAPQFLDCQSQGRALALANGRTVPMKCHWTAIAEIGLGAALGGLGLLLAFSRREESQRNLGIVGAIIGVFVFLTPAALIGVCSSAGMLCNMVMKPLLMLLGTAIIFAGLASAGISWRKPEQFA